MKQKTLAMKVLEGQGVVYEVFPYPETERDAAVIATIFAVPPSQVYKTLVVVRPPKKPILAMVGADRQVDLKKLAQVTGEKKLAMATHLEAEQLTRLKVGGISALALLNKGFVVYLDAPATAESHIFVSAGQKGLNLRVGVADLRRVLGTAVAEISQ